MTHIPSSLLSFYISANLGSLRQEYSSSSQVAVISEYVEMIKEKTVAVHNKVVETKKTLLDNKIEVDRHYPDCKEVPSVKTSTYWRPTLAAFDTRIIE